MNSKFFESRCRKWLGQDICDIGGGLNIFDFKFTSFEHLPAKLQTDIKVFGP
jgi:hypothetical protein